MIQQSPMSHLDLHQLIWYALSVPPACPATASFYLYIKDFIWIAGHSAVNHCEQDVVFTPRSLQWDSWTSLEASETTVSRNYNHIMRESWSQGSLSASTVCVIDQRKEGRAAWHEHQISDVAGDWMLPKWAAQLSLHMLFVFPLIFKTTPHYACFYMSHKRAFCKSPELIRHERDMRAACREELQLFLLQKSMKTHLCNEWLWGCYTKPKTHKHAGDLICTWDWLFEQTALNKQRSSQ